MIECGFCHKMIDEKDPANRSCSSCPYQGDCKKGVIRCPYCEYETPIPSDLSVGEVIVKSLKKIVGL